MALLSLPWRDAEANGPQNKAAPIGKGETPRDDAETVRTDSTGGSWSIWSSDNLFMYQGKNVNPADVPCGECGQNVGTTVLYAINNVTDTFGLQTNENKDAACSQAATKASVAPQESIGLNKIEEWEEKVVKEKMGEQANETKGDEAENIGNKKAEAPESKVNATSKSPAETPGKANGNRLVLNVMGRKRVKVNLPGSSSIPVKNDKQLVEESADNSLPSYICCHAEFQPGNSDDDDLSLDSNLNKFSCQYLGYLIGESVCCAMNDLSGCFGVNSEEVVAKELVKEGKTAAEPAEKSPKKLESVPDTDDTPKNEKVEEDPSGKDSRSTNEDIKEKELQSGLPTAASQTERHPLTIAQSLSDLMAGGIPTLGGSKFEESDIKKDESFGDSVSLDARQPSPSSKSQEESIPKAMSSFKDSDINGKLGNESKAANTEAKDGDPVRVKFAPNNDGNARETLDLIGGTDTGANASQSPQAENNGGLSRIATMNVNDFRKMSAKFLHSAVDFMCAEGERMETETMQATVSSASVDARDETETHVVGQSPISEDASKKRDNEVAPIERPSCSIVIGTKDWAKLEFPSREEEKEAGTSERTSPSIAIGTKDWDTWHHTTSVENLCQDDDEAAIDTVEDEEVQTDTEGTTGKEETEVGHAHQKKKRTWLPRKKSSSKSSGNETKQKQSSKLFRQRMPSVRSNTAKSQ